ncbi:MAG: hypothetical protein M3094_11130, partial [Actinomycetia bacterium]|nr:hypothetical protein [Actinomycetes bacterium]
VGVARVLDDRVHIWSFVARPEAAVGHALSDLGTHRLSMFPLTDLLPAIVEASGLRRSESSGAQGAELDAELIETMVTQGDGTTPVQSTSLDGLLAAGFDADAAALVARLTEESESGSVVTVLRPDSNRSVVGTVTVWIDAGDDGLWSVDQGGPEADGSSTVRLNPVTGDMMLASIVNGLPSAD